MSYVPDKFLSNFNDLAFIPTADDNFNDYHPRTMQEQPNIMFRAFAKLASVTNTHRSCYQAKSTDLTNITAVSFLETNARGLANTYVIKRHDHMKIHYNK